MNVTSLPRSQRWMLVGIFILILLALSVAFHEVTRGNNFGNDYYIYYVGGRTLLLEGKNPYSDEVAQTAQMAVYKHLAQPGEDQVGFAYPLYALLPILPLILLPYDWSQAIWLSLNILLLVSAFALLYPRAPKGLIFSFLAFYPVFFGFLLGNFAIIITVILFCTWALVTRVETTGWMAQAGLGLALAWATVKPQFAWLFIIVILLAALRRRQWVFLLGFGVGLFGWLGVAFLWMPDWLSAWVARVALYTQYNQTWLTLLFFLKQFLPEAVAVALTAGLTALIVLLTIVLVRRWWFGKIKEIDLLAWCGVVVFLLHPKGVAYEQIPFLIPVAIWMFAQTAPSTKMRVFWWVLLASSWLGFGLVRFVGVPVAMLELSFGVVAAWLLQRWWMQWIGSGAKSPEKVVASH